MKRRDRYSCLLVLFLFIAYGAVPLWADSTIDLRNLPGNFNQNLWGPNNSVIYAQSVVAEDSFLNEIRMLTTPNTGGAALVFNVLVTGARLDNIGAAFPDSNDAGGLGLAPNFADIRFTSPNITVPGGSFSTSDPQDSSRLVENVIHPNIAVAAGETLFIAFNTFQLGMPENGSEIWATEYNGSTDKYTPGEFVYSGATNFYSINSLDQLDSLQWGHRYSHHEDLALYVRFSGVPEPSTAALLAIGGVACLAIVRRKSASQHRV
jgi:hypothetical protein